MNSEEEGGEVGKGGIFSKIHYGDWGGGGWDLWQDLLRRLEGLEGGIFGKIHYGGALFVIYDWFWYSA